MPRTSVKHELDITTRGLYTKIGGEVSLVVNGKELPNMEVLGRALEKAVEIIQSEITESYKVPPRVDTPIAEPYKVTSP